MNIKENQVFVGNRQRHRRVVALFHEYVYYSDGGDTTKACLLATFVRWIKNNDAYIPI